MTSIQMASADIDEMDCEAVLAVVRSGRLALGERTLAFERAMADYIGVRNAVAVSSGTAALHLILLGLGIRPGDEVLVPSFTFAASVNAILFVGATPVFVDILPDTYTLDPEDADRKVTERTQAIMAVDVFGHPVEWDAIEALAVRHGLRIIDDSCEALGAEYMGQKLGTFGDAATFAFYPNKQITTGEGGMLVTDNDELAEATRSLRNQGRNQMGAWLEHERLGYNYRLDEMSAALGCSQLQKVEEILAKRAHVAEMYAQYLKDIVEIRLPVMRSYVRMSWFVYVVTLRDGLRREEMMLALQERGIPSRGYFSPIHRQPYIVEHFEGVPADLPITDSVVERTLALPFHNHLTEVDVKTVATALKSCLKSGAVAIDSRRTAA